MAKETIVHVYRADGKLMQKVAVPFVSNFCISLAGYNSSRWIEVTRPFEDKVIWKYPIKFFRGISDCVLTM